MLSSSIMDATAGFDEKDGAFVRSVLAWRAEEVQKQKKLAKMVKMAMNNKKKERAMAMEVYRRRKRAECLAIMQAILQRKKVMDDEPEIVDVWVVVPVVDLEEVVDAEVEPEVVADSMTIN